MILPDDSRTHIIFRCHNRQFLMKDESVKKYLLYLWARYKKRYGIRIHEFIIMDNHCHMLVRARSTEALGHFMRTVNSLIARYINRISDRDSQAIRERYRSPLITGEKYALRTMQYIWLNRFRVCGRNPLLDPWCSIAWRNNPDLITRFSNDEEGRLLLENLLDSDDLLYKGNVRRFVLNLLNDALSRPGNLSPEVFNHSHTIGDADAIGFRAALLRAFRLEKNPWPGHVAALAVGTN